MKHQSSSLNGGHFTFPQAPPASLLQSLHTHGEASAALSLVTIGTARFHHTSATRRANDHYAQSRAEHITQAEKHRDSIEHSPS